ncbi:hypothetical protein B0T21DRAFT_371975, partial [Apiosordaria backusii]
MSLADYEAKLPRVFSLSSSKDQKNDSTNDQNLASKKGFVDITEYRKPDCDGGYDSQIIPTSRYLPKGRKTTTKSTQKYDGYAVVLRRVVIQEGDSLGIIGVELEVQSQALCEALKKIARNCYEITDLHAFPLKISAPFAELFFYRKEIQELAEEGTGDIDAGLRQDAKVLHDFILGNGLLTSIIHDHDKYSDAGKVAGDILWTAFPPNSLAVLNQKDVQECWIVRSVTQKGNPKKGFYWEVRGLSIGANGKAPGMVQRSCAAAPVTMTLLTIADLPIVPLKHFRDREKLEIKLRERGTTLRRVLGCDLASFATQTYQGLGWEDMKFQDKNGYGYERSRQLHERVMVDYTSYYEVSENQPPMWFADLRSKTVSPTVKPVAARGIVTLSKDIESDESDDSDDADDSDDSDDSDESDDISRSGKAIKSLNNKRKEIDVGELLAFRSLEIGIKQHEGDLVADAIDYSPADLEGLARTVELTLGVSKQEFDLLYPAVIPAFGLRAKQWYWVLADGLSDVVWNMDAFKSLQLKGVTKQLVDSLVRGHKIGKTTPFDDVISGKGQGLVVLLCGDPGLGKTLTAESIADYMERPLYHVSGGELSTRVYKVEDRLEEIFYLSKRWDAVTLLDEADVLLRKRSSYEVERNAIVSGKYLLPTYLVLRQAS